MTTPSSRRRAVLAIATAAALVLPVSIAQAAPSQAVPQSATEAQVAVERAQVQLRTAQDTAKFARTTKTRTAAALKRAVAAERTARATEKSRKKAYMKAKKKATVAQKKAASTRVSAKKAQVNVAKVAPSQRAKARATARTRATAATKARASYVKAVRTRDVARQKYSAATKKRVAAVRTTTTARKAATAASRAVMKAEAAVSAANAALGEARASANAPSAPSAMPTTATPKPSPTTSATPKPSPATSAPASTTATTLIAKKSSWSYRYNETAPANDWQNTTATQPGWVTGTAGFGWGVSGLGTTINRDSQAKARAVTFRRTFQVSDPSKIAGVKIDTIADDGIVLYVNGVEVGRQNMVKGEIDTTTYASSTSGGSVTVTVPGSQLKAGANIIAASVHKNYSTTPSLQFDASVTTVPGTSVVAKLPGANGQDTGASIQGWGTPVWRDEFNGTSVDTTKWNVKDGTWMGYDQAIIQAKNVRVSDGELKIRTEWLDTPVTKSGRERHFSTGYIETIGKFSQQYGRWEMRASLPLEVGVSKGLWPAFWLRDSKGLGEIDIMEAIGDPHDKLGVLPAGAYTSTVHQSTNHEAGTVKIEKYHKGVDVRGGDYHVYAFEWTPAGMTFLYDGKVMWTATTKDNPWFATSFTSAGTNIRINTQVGDTWMGFADTTRKDLTKLPVDYKIDYVRVWAPQS